VTTREETDDPIGALPPEAAFVLQLQPTAGSARTAIAGRVEHIVSGRAARFGTSSELLAFIRRTVAGLAATRDRDAAAGLRVRTTRKGKGRT
jgi:hypothetical protein